MLAPIGVALVIVLGAFVYTAMTRRWRCSAADVLHCATPLVLRDAFLAYPVVTTVAFRAWPCYDFGQYGSWLMTDVAIGCGSREHSIARAFGYLQVSMQYLLDFIQCVKAILEGNSIGKT